MYPSCENNSALLKLAICKNINDTVDSFNNDIGLLRIVPISVIFIFGLIGTLGLLGNILVVIGNVLQLLRD